MDLPLLKHSATASKASIIVINCYYWNKVTKLGVEITKTVCLCKDFLL
jgi:hypothetical protein